MGVLGEVRHDLARSLGTDHPDVAHLDAILDRLDGNPPQ
jgi:hypothetical protein